MALFEAESAGNSGGDAMFVTMPQFGEPGMTAVAGAGQKYWRALAAVFPVELWYLFVFETQLLDARVQQTMLIAWEESLLGIIEGVPVTDRRAVDRVQAGSRGAVALQKVGAMCAATLEEVSRGVGAVFSFEGESVLVDANFSPMSASTSRQLVFRADFQLAADSRGAQH